ncbi:DUF4180 domain-containing protein [Dialister invisus]
MVCNRFFISKENFIEDFFNLSNKISGGIWQKLINYRMKLAWTINVKYF